MKTVPAFPLAKRVGFAVDRAISFFAPALGVARMRSRLEGMEMEGRMYAAAKITEDAGGWVPYDGDVNSLIRNSSQQVRARVRQLVRDFPYARRAIKLREALVVGRGIRMLPRLRDADGNLDAKNNAIVEDAFARWAEKADISGKMSFPDLQILAERQASEAGEFFFIKRFLKGEKQPFRLQAIEADRIATSHTSAIADGCAIESGIEYHKATGRVVAYHITDDGYSARTLRIPAHLMIHGYDIERPEQLRGISPMASAVMVAGNLSDLLESELEAMRMAVKPVAFVRSGNLSAFQAGNAVKGKDGKTVEHFDHATIQYLRTGEEVILSKVDRQSGTFQPYIKFNLRSFSVGYGLTYELVSGDYDSISYSNLRGIRLDLRMTILPIQRARINQLCRPVGQAWLDIATLIDPAIMPLAQRITTGCLGWMPPGMESPDPLREIKAFAEEFKLALRSPQEMCAARGRSYPEVLDEIADAKRMAKERGIELHEISTALKNNPAALMQGTEEEND